jgi:DNA gyrase subunit A
LVAIKVVTDENDLMIINKSGILIRLNVSEVRVMGRATQGVRLINLTKKNDTIASVCKVQKATEEELAEEALPTEDVEGTEVTEAPENDAPMVDFEEPAE